MRGYSRFHSVLAWITLLPLVVVCITGMILVFHDPIRFSQGAQGGRVLSSGENLEVWINKRRDLHPQYHLKAVYFPIGSGTTYRFLWEDPRSGNKHTEFIHPQSGLLLKEVIGKRGDFLDWILQIHRGTLGGTPGRIAMSFAGVLIAMLWPLGMLIKMRRNQTSQRRPLKVDLHRKLGALFGGFLSFMAITGALMNFYGELIQIFDPLPLRLQAESSSFGASLEKRMNTAVSLRASPNSMLRSLHFQKGMDLFYFSDHSRIYIDSMTGQIEKKMGPQTHWIHRLYPLHSGHLGGVLGSFFIFIGAGLILVILYTGAKKTFLVR